MSDLSLRLTISAINNAKAAFESLSKQVEETNKNIGKSNEYWTNKDKREKEKHEHWKTNLAEREAVKRIRIQEKEQREARRVLMQTETDFRSSAQRMALYTTAPATIMGVLGMRGFMEYEGQQKRLKMNFQEGAKDMEKFIMDYAQVSAFSINDLVSLTTTLQANSKALNIQSIAQVKDLTTTVGNTLLAFTNSAEERSRFMLQFQQILGRGTASQTELNIFNEVGINLKKFWAQMGKAPKGEKEQFTTQEILQILKYMQGTKEAQIAMIENAKSLTQAWDASKESINQIFVGYGKTLEKQFDLTDNTKIFAGLLQKISEKLKSDDNNLTKGMASYLTMLALTVAPMLMLIGHWRKISLLIGESNMKADIFGKRLFVASSAMSALYLISTDWKKVLEDIKENPIQGILTHLDTAIALALTLSGAFVGMGKVIDMMNKSLLLTNKTLVTLAKNPVIRMAGLAFTAYDTLSNDELIEKNLQKARSGGGMEIPFANLPSTQANPRNIEMLANLKSQPKIEVVNNIKVDKDGKVSVETNSNSKDKSTYTSPYSAPVMSPFSLGY